jgi:hypothetical protein
MGFECRISVGKLSYKNRAVSYCSAIIFADVKEPSALSQIISYIASIARPISPTPRRPALEARLGFLDKWRVTERQENSQVPCQARSDKDGYGGFR